MDSRKTLTLTEKQDTFFGDVIDRRIPNNAYVGGLGSGKTVAGAAICLTIAQQFPGSRQLLMAPTYDQLSQGTLQTFLEWCPPNYIQNHNRGEHLITFTFNNGEYNSELLYRSATEIDRIRAHEYAAAWLDELAMFREDSYQVIRGRLRSRRGMPKNWHYPVYGTTTPRGRNFLYRLFGPDRTDRKRFKMIHATTRDNQQNLPQDYISLQEAAFAGNESLRQQEIEGLFVTLEGLVWPQFTERLHVLPDPVGWDSPEIVRRVAGVDFGGGDPTAIVLAGQGRSGRWHVFEEKVWHVPVRLEDIGEWLMERHVKNPLTAVWCDPSNQVAIQSLKSGGLPAGPLQGHMSARAINARKEGISVVGGLFSRGMPDRPQLTVSPNCTELASQILSYVYKEANSPDGSKYITSTPMDHHADAPDALRYLLMGSVTSRTVSRKRSRRRMMAAA